MKEIQMISPKNNQFLHHQVPLLDMKVYNKLLAGASWTGEVSCYAHTNFSASLNREEGWRFPLGPLGKMVTL